MSTTITEEKTNWLDRPVLAIMKLDAEKTLYLVFILLAIFTRFWMLGARTMSHDESLHTFYSWNLYKGGGYSHTPLTHGPFLFHINALIYSLFGADDFTSRISVALFGIALVALPYFLRRWLGRIGALITSFMILISPSILYHARYIRDEAYMLAYGVVIAWAMFAYLRERKTKWLYLAAIASAFMYISMEAAFIFAAIFGLFLVVATMVELSTHTDFWKNIVLKTVLGLAGAALIAMIIVIVQVLILGAIGLGPGDQSPFPIPPQPIQPGLPVEFSAQLQYDFELLVAVVRVSLSILIPAGLIAFAVYQWLKYILPARLRDSAAFDLAALILTLSLFMLSAGALVILNPLWKATFTAGQVPPTPFVDVSFFKDGNFPTNDVGLVLRLAALFGAFAAVSAAIGWWWNRRVWLISSGIFIGVGTTFFTTVFTNGVGLGTGFVGSLGYWLEQQSVQRGSQPFYYYFVITPIYEYLPMLISIIATIAYLVRWFRNRRSARLAPWDQRLFVPFLIWWCFASWMAYSYAGEKMPWLMVYLALPMIFLSGRFLSEWFDRIDWRAIIRERQWLAGLLFAAAIISGAWTIGNLQKALSGNQLDSLVAFSSWLGALVVLVLSVWALIAWKPRPTAPVLARLSALIGLIVLTALTIRTSWIWNYINYDMALEFGVYAHGGPTVKEAMKQIEELSQRTTGGKLARIAFDADASWPFYWYLRDYPNKYQISNTPSRSDLDAPIILSSGKTWDSVDAVVRRTYTQWQGHRIWWPMEDYKRFAECPFNETDPATGQVTTIAAYDENGDRTIDDTETARGRSRCTNYIMRHLPEYAGDLVGTLWRWGTDPERRLALMDIFLNRDYTHYDQIRGTTHKPEAWPLAEDFRLYVRKDIANQIWTEAAGGVAPATTEPQVDPYVKGWKDIAAVQVFGTIGSEPGQFQSPHGIRVAPDGSIYVADGTNHRIQKFDPGGKLITAIGGPEASSAIGLFKEPWDMAIGPDDSLYVVDTWNHRIQKFNSAGAVVTAWGQYTITDGQAVGNESLFYGPRGIAVDANGRVLVADTGNKRVQIFNGDGAFVSQFGGGGLEQGRLDEPVGIATDPKGNIVVADTWNGRVQVFDSNGQPIAAWEIDGWLDKELVGKPYLAVDNQSRVYVADEVGRRVLIFDLTGKYLGGFGQYGTDDHGFVSPGGIAVDKDGNIYVVDTGTARIMKFPPFRP